MYQSLGIFGELACSSPSRFFLVSARTCVCADTNADGWPFMADQSQIASENEDIENNLLCSHFGSYIHLNFFFLIYFKSMRSVRLNKQETNQSNYSQPNTNL